MFQSVVRLFTALLTLSLTAAVAPAQQLYVGTFFGNTLLQYPSVAPGTGTVVASPANGVLGVAGIAQRSGDAAVYFSSQLFNPTFGIGDAIFKYTPGGSVTPVVLHSTLHEIVNPGNPGGTNSYAPAGITFGSDGFLYVARSTGLFPTPGASAVDRFNADTGAYVNTVATGLTGTVGVTASGNDLFISNRLLGADGVSNPVPGNITKISNYATTPSSSILFSGGAGTARFPVNSAMGPDGMLYVADVGDELGSYSNGNFPYSGGIYRYDPVTGVRDAAFSMPMSGKSPSGLSFTLDNKLLVANLGTSYGPDISGQPFNGNVELWDVLGSSPSLLSTIDSGLMASALLVTPVPEPGLLFLAGGLAVCGFRRRK